MPTLFHSLHFSPSFTLCISLLGIHTHTVANNIHFFLATVCAVSAWAVLPQLLWSSPSVKVSQVQRCVFVVLFKVEAARKWYEEQQQKKRRVSKDSTNKLRRMCCASSSSTSSSPSYLLFVLLPLLCIILISLCFLLSYSVELPEWCVIKPNWLIDWFVLLFLLLLCLLVLWMLLRCCCRHAVIASKPKHKQAVHSRVCVCVCVWVILLKFFQCFLTAEQRQS